MKIILSSNTKREILVDDEDFERLSKFKWSDSGTTIARSSGRVNHEYAKNWQTIHISIANEILNTTSIQYDHKDRNYLNNQKLNLRIANNSQNGHNRTKYQGYSSFYKGVSEYKRNRYKCWDANIRLNGKLIHIGRFRTELEAALAYNEKAKELFGEYACINIIQENINA
jgi:hypothetical protein